MPETAPVAKAEAEAGGPTEVTGAAGAAPVPSAAAETAVAVPAAAADASPDSGYTLHVNVEELVVPTIVRDKRGQAVGSLGKEDFAITDGGKARAIAGFTVVKAGGSTAPIAVPASAPKEEAAVGPQKASPANRFLVFLFDDRHFTAEDLAHVQTAATHMLDGPMAETDAADVISFMGVNSGFSRDREALKAAVMKVTVHQALQHNREDCPDVDYYSGDQIVHKHNAMEFQIAVEKAKKCTAVQMYSPGSSANIYSGMDNPTDVYQRAATAAASHAVAVGEEDARDSIAAVGAVIRAMAKLPGQRTLILVSPGFLSLSGETMAFKSQVIDQAAAANVVVNAIDARGLYAGNVDASQGGRTSMLGLMTGEQTQNQLAAAQANEDAMAELAYGTGGTFFHNSNDLEGGLRSVSAAPEYLYLLEISLKDVKKDGAYHRLQVKVDQPGLDVQARRGYVAPKAANKK